MYQFRNLVEPDEFQEYFERKQMENLNAPETEHETKSCKKSKKKRNRDSDNKDQRKNRKSPKVSKRVQFDKENFHLLALNAYFESKTRDSELETVPSKFESMKHVRQTLRPLIVEEAKYMVQQSMKLNSKRGILHLQLKFLSSESRQNMYAFQIPGKSTAGLPRACFHQSTVYLLQIDDTRCVPAIVSNANEESNTLFMDCFFNNDEYDSIRRCRTIDAYVGESLVSLARMYRCHVKSLAFQYQVLGITPKKKTHILFHDSDDEELLDENDSLPVTVSSHISELGSFSNDIKGLLYDLNPSQRKAVAKAIHELQEGTAGVHLWQGPPGTGKTRSISNYLQIVALGNRDLDARSKRHKRVMVCAPSNQAVKVVLQNFVEDLQLNGRKIPRIALVGVDEMIDDTVREYFVHDALSTFLSKLATLIEKLKDDATICDQLHAILVDMQERLPSLASKLTPAIQAVAILRGKLTTNTASGMPLRLTGGSSTVDTFAGEPVQELVANCTSELVLRHVSEVFKLLMLQDEIQSPVHGPCESADTAPWLWIRRGFVLDANLRRVVAESDGLPGRLGVDFFTSESSVVLAYFHDPSWHLRCPRPLEYLCQVQNTDEVAKVDETSEIIEHEFSSDMDQSRDEVFENSEIASIGVVDSSFDQEFPIESSSSVSNTNHMLHDPEICIVDSSDEQEVEKSKESVPASNTTQHIDTHNEAAKPECVFIDQQVAKTQPCEPEVTVAEAEIPVGVAFENITKSFTDTSEESVDSSKSLSHLMHESELAVSNTIESVIKKPVLDSLDHDARARKGFVEDTVTPTNKLFLFGDGDSSSDSESESCTDISDRSHKSPAIVAEASKSTASTRSSSSSSSSDDDSDEENTRCSDSMSRQELPSFWIENLKQILNQIEFEYTHAQSIEADMIHTADFVFCTLAVSGRTSVLRVNESKKIDVVIVDEAAQAIEAETWIPLQATPSQFILVGDPQQLNATVISAVTQKYGFQRSMMDRLMFECQFPFTMFDTQYRMHPSIVKFPNRRYYDNKLQNGDNVCSRTMTKPPKVHFYPYMVWDVTEGRESRSGNKKNSSIANLEEAREIARKLKMWQKEGFAIHNRVVVITFYSHQISCIKKELRHQGIRDVQVLTVDSFQGSEAEVVFLSFVRSNDKNHVGFLSDFRRLNVALTRAKHCLFIFANVKTFIKSDNEELRQLFSEAKKAHLITKVAESR